MKRIAAVSLTILATLTSLIAGEFDFSIAGAPDAPRKNWRKQEPLPTPWDFADVAMISANEGWAVSHPVTGDSASLFHTTNGGKSWKAQGGLFRQLNGVSFIDAQHGVAVGDEVRLGVDSKYTLVASSKTPMAMVEGIAAGLTMDFIAQAVNGSAQSVPTDAITVTTPVPPAVAPEKPAISEAELALLAAITPNGNGNGNGSPV